MTRKWGRAMGEDDDENIAGGRAGGGHRRRLVPALVLVACVLLGQACICDAQLSPSSDIATARKDEGGECSKELVLFFSVSLYFCTLRNLVRCCASRRREIRSCKFFPRSSLGAFIKSGDFTPVRQLMLCDENKSPARFASHAVRVK
jgi:hypothetical protein